MRHIIGILLLLAVSVAAQAQNRHMTREGHISFHSSAPLEDIEAHNYQVNSVVDLATGDMAFSLLMKGFEFEKALMQEHFNEKYVESDKYPKAQFEGTFKADEPVDLETDGEYPVHVSGNLTIHGVTQPVATEGTFAVKEGKLHGQAIFSLTIADYEIEVPAVVRDNIARVIEITVDMVYDPMKN